MKRRLPLPVFCPPPALCTDNAVGTAMAGYYRLRRGLVSGLDLDVAPSLRLV
jgi:N6-L-threonylcarbamoyladenine synthase